ncbi:jg24467 [Pararge aegeria aegeria]|uniref:Jg24467 protein n=1 Tax=Pararge aegeria aegeria TaxID=348720 RepID=A0A8S4QE01_9NEOP|nr:jg24467 [Pararge aegeria aegeria]
MLGVSLNDQIRNAEINRRARVTVIAQRCEAKVAMAGALSWENRWRSWCWNGKRSDIWPPTRGTHDIKGFAVSLWKQATQDGEF